jgi:hypothetical protein
VKTYVGQRGRDRVLHVWIENYGRRVLMPGDDVAGRILADVFGPRLIEDDYWCYQTFRDEFMRPRLEEAEWSLTEADIRGWREMYTAQARHKPAAAAETEAGAEAAAEAPAASPPDSQPAKATTGEGIEAHALVSWPNGITRAQLLHMTASVLVLEGEHPPGAQPSPGLPVRVGLPGDPRMIAGRLAAFGRGGRFLVAVGSRPVRGAMRYRVDLPAVVRALATNEVSTAELIDLSSTGARLRGVRLPVGGECDLTFMPPGGHEVVNLRCVVVRTIAHAEQEDVGVAFRSGSQSFNTDPAVRGQATAG